jgi:hypothetical protein
MRYVLHLGGRGGDIDIPLVEAAVPIDVDVDRGRIDAARIGRAKEIANASASAAPRSEREQHQQDGGKGRALFAG